MTMGDRIAVMSLGVLQQLDTPQNLYDNPVNKFVAGFIGSPSMNFLDVNLQASDGKLFATTPGFRMRVPDQKGRPLEKYIGQTVTLGVRPEHLVERSRIAVPPDATIPTTVDVVELLGNEIFVYLTSNGTVLTARMDPSLHLQRGQQIEVAAEPERLHFFDPQSEEVVA
jgi:multiple sugar transport system ATP-binding protein